MTYKSFYKEEKAKYSNLGDAEFAEQISKDILKLKYADMDDELLEAWLFTAIEKIPNEMYIELDKNFRNEEWHRHITFTDNETLKQFYNYDDTDMLEEMSDKEKEQCNKVLERIESVFVD